MASFLSRNQVGSASRTLLLAIGVLCALSANAWADKCSKQIQDASVQAAGSENDKNNGAALTRKYDDQNGTRGVLDIQQVFKEPNMAAQNFQYAGAGDIGGAQWPALGPVVTQSIQEKPNDFQQEKNGNSGRQTNTGPAVFGNKKPDKECPQKAAPTCDWMKGCGA